jgi:hypothetical protein
LLDEIGSCASGCLNGIGVEGGAAGLNNSTFCCVFFVPGVPDVSFSSSCSNKDPARNCVLLSNKRSRDLCVYDKVEK